PQVYSGFPTTATSVSNLPGFSDTAATNGGQAGTFYIDAYFTHLNGTGAPSGINTFYLSDDGTSFAHGAITNWWRNRGSISSASVSGPTVTITLSAAAPLAFVSGQTATISGVSGTGFNGTFTITVVDSTHFTYTDASASGTGSGGTASQWQVTDH